MPPPRVHKSAIIDLYKTFGIRHNTKNTYSTQKHHTYIYKYVTA